MDKPGTDIVQIRKYLNGELDAKAMHRLEREAQDDPFLMDALEGYEMAGKDQRPNLTLLTEQLDSRITEKERRIIPWMTISIAAGVVGFMIVVGLLYRANNGATVVAPRTAQIQPKSPQLTDTAGTAPIPKLADKNTGSALPAQRGSSKLTALVTKSRTSPAKQFSVEPPPAAEIAAAPSGNAIVKEDTSSGMADMVMGVIAKQKDSAAMPLTIAISKHPISQSLQGKVDGVTTSESKSQNNLYKLNSLNLPAEQAGYLAGVVVNRSGEPMPGVTVKVVGKPEVTQTDAKGGFALPVTKGKETLDFSYLGFYSKKLSTKSNDSLKVEMRENTSALNEVAIANENINSQIATPEKTTHPAAGWYAFNNYIKKNAVLPAGAKTGFVKLKFTVNPDGSIGTISVIKSLSPVADEQAVSIIRHGGKWTASSNGKKQIVIKDIEFTTVQK